MSKRLRPVARLGWAALALALLSVALPPRGRAQPLDSTLPVIDAPVTDLAGVLSADQLRSLEEQLLAHRQATGVQLAVLVITTTGDEPIEDYALRVATRWRGGSDERDEGALYVLAVADRRQRLEVGYGLEDRVSDSTAARILSASVPHLRSEDYDAATRAVVDGMISATLDMQPLPQTSHTGRDDLVSAARGLRNVGLYFVIVLLGTFVGRFHRLRQARRHTEDMAAVVGSSEDLRAQALLALFVLASGTAAGLLGCGWFHYAAAFVGLLAGTRFAWDSVFKTLHYLFMASIFGIVGAAVTAGFSGQVTLGILASCILQVFVTLLYSMDPVGQRIRFSASGAVDPDIAEANAFFRALRAPTATVGRQPSSSFMSSGQRSAHEPTSSSPWPSSSSFGSSSSSSFGSSSSSSFGSSSSHSSSHSSSGSSGYSGGGGRFGGGGASSSW